MELEINLNKSSEQVIVAGKTVACTHCGDDRFFSREALLNTRGLTLFNAEFFNKEAQVYVCASCGHLEWFLLPS